MTYNKPHMENTFNTRIDARSQFWHFLFKADSIAVIGANSTPGSWGFDAMRTAQAAAKSDSRKQVYAVNPNAREVMGLTSYASILDIPGPVELAVIVVRSDIVPPVMRQCEQKGVKAAVIISAGFAEVDDAGRKLQAEVVETAHRGGIHFVGPNCIGHADVHSRVGSAMVASNAVPGPVSLITQSGTLGATIVQMATSQGIGISKFVSTGNEADLRFEDYLEYLAQDNDTHIITGYIEGLREGRRFFELAKSITAKKPIIVIKTGTTEQSSQAAKSHTGALAGADAVYSAAFKQAGVIRVDDDEELCDVVSGLLNMPLPRGKGVGILTMGGGFGVITAEACEKEGLRIPALEPQTIEKLNAILPPRWSHSNPVDLVGIKTMGADPTIPNCISMLMEDRNIDVLISLLPPVTAPIGMLGSLSPEQLQTMQKEYREYMQFLNSLAVKHKKPIILLRLFFNQAEKSVMGNLLTNDIRVPGYSKPRRIARVLKHLTWYREYLEGKRSNP